MFRFLNTRSPTAYLHRCTRPRTETTPRWPQRKREDPRYRPMESSDILRRICHKRYMRRECPASSAVEGYQKERRSSKSPRLQKPIRRNFNRSTSSPESALDVRRRKDCSLVRNSREWPEPPCRTASRHGRQLSTGLRLFRPAPTNQPEHS